MEKLSGLCSDCPLDSENKKYSLISLGMDNVLGPMEEEPRILVPVLSILSFFKTCLIQRELKK